MENNKLQVLEISETITNTYYITQEYCKKKGQKKGIGIIVTEER